VYVFHNLLPRSLTNGFFLQGRGWRTAAGKQPTNLDLFLKLDEVTTSLEKDGVAVGFWYIPRAYNHKADHLAKLATGV